VVNKFDPATGWGVTQTLLAHPVSLVTSALDADGLGIVIQIDDGTCNLVREVMNVGWATSPLKDIGNLSCMDTVAGGTQGATIMTAGDIPPTGTGLDFDVRTIDAGGAQTTTLSPNQTPYQARHILAIGSDVSTSLVVSALGDGTTAQWGPVSDSTPTQVMNETFNAGTSSSHGDFTYGVLLATPRPSSSVISRFDRVGWHIGEAEISGACPPLPEPLPVVAIASTDRAIVVWSAAPVGGGLCNINAIRLR
jgi:hypothetical protein